MNGHHESCDCQPCTIGREIGMDRALELIEEMEGALRYLRSEVCMYWGDPKSGATHPKFFDQAMSLVTGSIAKSAAFLKEHGHE